MSNEWVKWVGSDPPGARPLQPGERLGPGDWIEITALGDEEPTFVQIPEE